MTDAPWLRKLTRLLPPSGLSPIDEKDVIRYAPKPSTIVPYPTIPDNILLGTFTDEEFLEVFPPRGNADLSIRESRASTVHRLYKAGGFDWTSIRYLGNLDYITVCNILLAATFNSSLIPLLRKVKALGSLDDFLTFTKWLSDRVKSNPCSMEFRMRYAELAGLTGYRQPPFPGFDMLKQTTDLAHGGIVHTHPFTDFMTAFKSKTDEIIGSCTPEPVTYMSLAEFIDSGMAMTSGASSVGRIPFKEHKVKARKNFLPYIFTTQHLYDEALTHSQHPTNSAFIKAELGKMRVAVTGDIWTYLIQSWLNYLCGHEYLQLPGNTLEETLEQQLARIVLMRNRTGSAFQLPFDFEKFDHQPTFPELAYLQTAHFSTAHVNVPVPLQDTWRKFVSSAEAGIYNTRITVHVDGIKHDIEVTGGVQSGQRLTSFMGNTWNTVMTSLAIDILKTLGIQSAPTFFLRGDDSALSASYSSCLLMQLAYVSMGVLANESKYSIHSDATEFLRVWYDAQRCWGLPNRAIPGIMQRKPWSSDPWTPESSLRRLLENVAVMERRGLDVTALRAVVVQDWTRRRKLSNRWLQLPSALGGFGLLPYQGYAPTSKIPKFVKPLFEFDLSPPAEAYTRKQFEFVELTPSEVQRFTIEDMSQLVYADDIPSRSKQARIDYDHVLNEMRKVKFELTAEFKIVTPSDIRAALANAMGTSSTVMPPQFSKLPLYGSQSHNASKFERVKRVARARDMKLMPALTLWLPEVADATLVLEQTMGMHRSFALDFVFGTLDAPCVAITHPLLLRYVTAYTLLLTGVRHRRTRTAWANTFAAAYPTFDRAVFDSPLSQANFLW
jgi:hypothetical protein